MFELDVKGEKEMKNCRGLRKESNSVRLFRSAHLASPSEMHVDTAANSHKYLLKFPGRFYSAKLLWIVKL